MIKDKRFCCRWQGPQSVLPWQPYSGGVSACVCWRCASPDQ